MRNVSYFSWTTIHKRDVASKKGTSMRAHGRCWIFDGIVLLKGYSVLRANLIKVFSLKKCRRCDDNLNS